MLHILVSILKSCSHCSDGMLVALRCKLRQDFERGPDTARREDLSDTDGTDVRDYSDSDASAASSWERPL